MCTLGLGSWSPMSSTDINLDTNIPNRHVAQPNIHNRHQTQSNNSFPPLQISVYYTLVPQLSQTDIVPLQPTLVLLNIHQVSAELVTRCQVFTDFFNRLHGRRNYLQPAPRLLEILSANAGTFKPASQIL